MRVTVSGRRPARDAARTGESIPFLMQTCGLTHRTASPYSRAKME